MPHLTSGLYQIRYIPRDTSAPYPPGGMYATSTNWDAPIVGDALGDKAAGEQIWQVEAVDGKTDCFHISTPQVPNMQGVGPVLFGWGLNGTAINDTVTFQVQMTEWVIESCDASDDHIYTIVPAHEPKDASPGTAYIVDLHKDNKTLFLNQCPAFFEQPIIARWQFVQAKEGSDK